jgi:hypothetical protein
VHWSRHIVTEGTFSITKEAKPTSSIWGTRVNDGTFRQVRGAEKGREDIDWKQLAVFGDDSQAKHFFSW